MIYGFTILEILLIGSAIGTFLLVLMLLFMSQKDTDQESPVKGYDENLADITQPKEPAKSMDMQTTKLTSADSKTLNSIQTSAPVSKPTAPVNDEETTFKKLKIEEKPTESNIVKVTHKPALEQDKRYEDTNDTTEPLPVMRGLVLWLDVAEQSTLSQDSKGLVPVTQQGQKVGRLADKSGFANHAVQIDSDKQPTYLEKSTNDNPGIVFDDSYMEGLKELGANKTYTIFFVGQKHTKDNTWPGVFTTKPSGSQDESGKQGFAVFGEKNSYGFKFEMGDVYFNDSNKEESQLSLVVGTDSDNNSSNKYILGNWITLDQGFTGMICEIIVFDRALADEERNLITTHLQTKWFDQK
jgi:hypothetical protein